MNQQPKPIKPTLLFDTTKEFTSWDEWLQESEEDLEQSGYRKYKHDYRGSDFQYFKTFKEEDKNTYQVAILFYDFRKYTNKYPDSNRIGIAYSCLLMGNSRIDLEVSKNITLMEFEKMAAQFYQSMNQFNESED